MFPADRKTQIWYVLTTMNQEDNDRAEQDEFESLVTDVAAYIPRV